MALNLIFLLSIFALGFVGYFYATAKKEISIAHKKDRFFMSSYVFLRVLTLNLSIFIIFLFFENIINQHMDLENNIYFYIKIIFLSFSFLFIVFMSLKKIRKTTQFLIKRDQYLKIWISIPLWITIFLCFGIIIILIDGTIQFFHKANLFDFLFELDWKPFSVITQWGHDYEGGFGVIPLLFGSFFVAFIALFYAIPLSILSALFLSEYASPKWTNILKPIIELLAGIPTIVYGFFAVLVVTPYVQFLAHLCDFTASSENVLSASLVMGIMLIPYVLSTSLEAFQAVPKTMRDASYAMGATKWETIYHIILPETWGTVLASILLALSRALGETMIVVMALGVSAQLSLNPLESTTTITVQILSILTGDQEFDSPKTLVTFALALTLFMITFILNTIAYKKIKGKKRNG
ncbi:MAG: phosphate ABC transporter permease subunit PstC [Alphaproteobacteria bacterium]|nr:phosphate ABC transporter permease subunit PstC [Alphaproteobacteria bacterium]